MLRLNVLSGTTVLTMLGRRALRSAPAFPKNPFSAPERTQKTGMRRPDICRSDWISLENRFPVPS
jgi:hypothetical protein